MTATVYTYFHQCPRKMWLHRHQIMMEHTSDLVAEGRILHETSYPQRVTRYRELQLPGVKIDHYDPQQGIVHETKKSPKRKPAHRAQLLFYLWTLEQHGLTVSHGILEYPKQRQREEVVLTDLDREQIPRWIEQIRRVLAGPCPDRLPHRQCKQCSYHDFCWAEES